MKHDIQILAKTIYGEANHHNLSEMEAIANVIINRVKQSQNGMNVWWGETIAQVCLKPAQFSCWQPNSKIDWLQPLNDAVYQICRRIAVRAIKGLLPDNTKGGVYYHSIHTHPRWAYASVPCAKIGDLLFYDII